MSELLKNLNEAQCAAVTDYQSPSLIVAGAGSGKTRVLTSRIAYMLEQGVAPWQILALTFTNKAAGEMRERIGTMVSPEKARSLWMGTFHSIFLRILRAEADKLGYPSSFTIYDTADSRNLIKNLVKEMDLNTDSYKPAAVAARISLAKNNLVTPDAYAANAGYLAEDRERKIPAVSDIYTKYVQRCRANGAMDFDDLLLNINILFKDFPEVLARYQERFQYILVDEYQDTNYAQYIIIRRLAERHHRVCVVGDDSQSIYSFRGARLENILRFRNDYPEAKTFKLEQNYRSTSTIVDAANSVIEKNQNRIDKKCFSESGAGDKIMVMKAYTDQEEAAAVADDIRATIRERGAQWSEAAVLYRTNMQSRVLEEAFRRRGIPYKIYGGMSFYQRKEVKDLLAYIQLVVNPKDDISFRRVVNLPARGIGDVTLGRMGELAASKGVSMLEASLAEDLKAAGLNAGTAGRIREFASMIAGLAALADTCGLYEFGLEVATRSGLIGALKAERTIEAQSALENIEELLNSMQTYADDDNRVMEFDPETGEAVVPDRTAPKVADWLQSIALLTDQDNEKDENRNKVAMMTVHSAKGLEYRFVYIVGLEENLFPSQMSMNGEEGVEEERRLFYVALTRACERAVVTFSQTRFKWGSMEFCRPSRFLSEIDPAYLDLAFDPSELSEGDSPAAMLKRNYDAHNSRDSRYGREQDGGRGKYGAGRGEGRQYGGGRDGGRQYNRPGTGRQTEASAPVRPASPGGNFRKIPAAGAAGGSHSGARYPQTGTGAGQAGAPLGGASGGGVSAGAAGAAAESRATSGSYAAGQRVAHAKFGIGTVEAVEQLSSDLKITVVFDDPIAGRKTLLAKFARLAIVG